MNRYRKPIRPFKKDESANHSWMDAFGLTPTSRMFPVNKIPKGEIKRIKSNVKRIKAIVEESHVPPHFRPSADTYFADLKRCPILSQRWLFALRQLISLTEFQTREKRVKAIKYLNRMMTLDPLGELENSIHLLTLDGEVVFATTNKDDVNQWANLLTIKTSPTRVETTQIKLNHVSEDLKSYMDGYKPRKKKRKGKRS
ncbi:hypothetical protein GR7B_00043 [Vibrio phage vB_VcorM_GR7B]|nr:hypothetical protein GR7B_00043 [Vibrio phage vB_VcorM_GR7B]